MSKNRRRGSKPRKPSSSNKGNESSTKGNHGVNTIPMDSDPTPGIHDGSMLSGLSDAQITDVGSIPWSYPAGRPQDVLPAKVGTVPWVTKESVPGIMAIDVVVGPGRSWDYWSPVNQAALNQMTFLRSNNSRSDSHYQASDLILYEMAMESAFILYQVVKRAYYIAKKWDSTNRYTPDALLAMMGFDYKDFKRNLPMIRSYMDQFMYMIGSLPLPANLEIFKRHLTMFSNIYEDSTTCKAQYYMFRPKGLYIYDEWRRDLPKTETVRPGRCRFVPWNNLVQMKWYASHQDYPAGWGLDTDTEPKERLSTADLFEIFDFIGSTLMSSDDIMKMGADIEKAYGANVWYLDPLERDTTLVPVHDEEVLLMIHNCRMYNPTTPSLHIEQTATGLETGDALIQWSPEFSKNLRSEAEYFAHNPYPLVDQWTDQPTPKMVVTATRLQPTLGEPTVSGTTNNEIVCGTMFPTGASVMTVRGDGMFDVYEFANWFAGGSSNSFVDKLTKFDWHPLLYIGVYDDNTQRNVLTSYDVVGDLDSWTTFSYSLLKRQNEVDTIAQWKIPETAYYR